MEDFIHLHVHTHYSILDGQSKVANLVKKAVGDGMRGMAITDHGVMYGVKELADCCAKVNKERKAEGLEPFKPIFGCEMYVARRTKEDKDKAMGDNSGYHLVVLAKNYKGYKNLIKLVSRAWVDGYYYKPRTDRADLERYHEGLIVCSACIAGEVPRKILDGDLEGAREAAQWYHDLFGDDYYLELQLHKATVERANHEAYPMQLHVNKHLRELAAKHNVRMVCTNDVHFVDEDNAEAHDRLICLSTGKDLDDPKRMLYSKQEWLKTREEMAAIFGDVPEAMATTVEICEQVETYSIDHSPIMPTFEIPAEFGTEEGYRQRFSEKDLFDEFTQDENGNVVIDPETGKPKKDPKTQVPYTVLDDIHEIEALPETTEKEIAYKNFRREAIKPYKQMRIPQPDFVLCCNNICNCMTKWYENIARMCNIPLIMVDIPYNNTVEVSDSAVKYVRAQFDNAIHQLEELTGKKFDEAKFEAACKHANRTAQNWLKVCDYLQYKPAPMSGFDLFNHMADVVTARGKEAAADAFELLAQDLEQNIKEGTSTLPFPEKYRVMFEGIPCWPKLPNLFKPLKENGVNVTAVVYAPAFGFVYNNMDEMARAYYKAPNSVCIEQGVAWREGICRDNKVDGVLVHYNRSCKPWSGYMAEMQRRFTKDLGVPCAGFDGDQADPRNFNEAQYATRVQGLVVAMEANKKD